MAKKKIGVDIDAVLTKEGRGEENIWYQEICNYFDLQEQQRNVYDFTEAFGVSNEEVKQFMADKAHEIFRSLPPAPKAKQVLTKLKNQGFTIILITARNDKYRNLTLNWLEKHQIPFDQLIHSKHKADVCQELGVELFIDDKLENLQSIKENMEIPLLLMDMDHNQHYEGAIPRVNNWLEIKEKINKIY